MQLQRCKYSLYHPKTPLSTQFSIKVLPFGILQIAIRINSEKNYQTYAPSELSTIFNKLDLSSLLYYTYGLGIAKPI